MGRKVGVIVGNGRATIAVDRVAGAVGAKVAGCNMSVTAGLGSGVASTWDDEPLLSTAGESAVNHPQPLNNNGKIKTNKQRNIIYAEKIASAFAKLGILLTESSEITKNFLDSTWSFTPKR